MLRDVRDKLMRKRWLWQRKSLRGPYLDAEVVFAIKEPNYERSQGDSRHEAYTF